MRRHLNRIIATTLSLALSSAGVAQAEGCFRGINLSGAEFGSPGGAIDKDYTYPSEATVAYFAGRGFNTVRLPFKWERLQPRLSAPLDPAELARLDGAVALIRQNGMRIILDPHNYAHYLEKPIGSAAVPVEAFGDFWRRLAAHYKGQADVIFGLMNEPNAISAEQWLKGANAAVAQIRAVGAENLVLVPGTAWTGAHSWEGGSYGTANAKVMTGIADPLDHYAFEVHQYFDADFSGTKGDCSRAEDAVAAVERFGSWLRANRARGFLGEFGVPGGERCVAALSRMVAVVEQDRKLWTGWAYWVAGDWWSPDEPLNIQPTSAGDRPQMKGLSKALKDFSASAASCPALER